MNEHLGLSLEAYYDGELTGRRRREVEAHLERCGPCQRELARLRSLSSLLQEVPAYEPITPPEQFVSQVRLQLPPRAAPLGYRALRLSWWSVPMLLLVGWGVLQSLGLVIALVLVALEAGLGEVLGLAPPSMSVVEELLALREGGWLGFLPVAGTVLPAVIILLQSVGTAIVAYGAWLVAWLLRSRGLKIEY
jgi:anti-sigma factor RsiW